MTAENLTETPSHTTIDIGIGGMTCASCVMRVEKALKKVPGVDSATVNLATESARIAVHDAGMEARLRRAVRDAGYEPLAPSAAIDAQDASPWAGFGPVGIGLGAVCAAGTTHGRRPVRQRLDAACAVAIFAGHSGAVHFGGTFLQGRLARAAGAHRQYGFAGGAGHLGGLGAVHVVVADRP